MSFKEYIEEILQNEVLMLFVSLSEPKSLLFPQIKQGTGYLNLTHFPSDYFISVPFVLSFFLMHKKKAGTPTDQSLRSSPHHTMADTSATD